MVEFHRCTEIFKFAQKWHRIEILQIMEHSVSRCIRWSWNINQWLEIFLFYLNFWGHLASTFGSALTCFSGFRSTLLWDCPVDTERGMNSTVQHVNIVIFSIEVNGVSIIFLLEYSTAQRAYPWNTGCPEFSQFSTSCDARRSNLPPQSLTPLAFFSGSQECPAAIVEIWGVFFDLPWGKSTRIFVIFPFPIQCHWTLTWRLFDHWIYQVMFFPYKSAWIMWRVSNALAPGKIFHSK